MADNDPNESKKPPQNTREVSKDYLPADVTRILKNAGYESQKYQQTTMVIGETQESYWAAKAAPSLLNSPDLRKEVERYTKARRFAEDYETSSRIRTVSQVESSINRSFGSINGEIQRDLATTAGQHMAMRTATSVSPEQVESSVAASSANMKGLQEKIRKIATTRLVNKSGIPDQEARAEMSELYEQVEKEKQQQVRFTGAAKIHKMQGLDATSRTENLIGDVDKAQKRL